MAGYDVIGNIVILKFSRDVKMSEKKKVAKKFLLQNKHVTTVLEKTDKIKGRLRTPTTKYLAGDKTKEALYKENGCEFRLNVDECYFSSRLASERKEIASMTKKNESVLVMFGGVAPFAIAIAKLAKPKKVISVELGKACCRYALENVKRNKLAGRVEIIQGDVRKKVPLLKEKFDRIVMSRPNLKESFLDVTFPNIKKNGMIHYYGFYNINEADKMRDLIIDKAREARKKIKILMIKKAGNIAPYRFRYRADIKVLN